MDTKTFFIPTRVAYGAGSFAQLGGLCAPLGTRPFIVTGRRSARESGLLDRVLAVFPEAVVFDEVEENPGVAVCARGGERCRAAACDFVLALGGGSPMDAAKAVAVLARQDAPGSALFSAPAGEGDVLPLAAVATTSGTGSEVTPYSVLLDPDTGMKRTLRGPGLFPRVAVVDPELTMSMPAAVTAATGLDALSQAMEGLVSRTATPVGDALALEACTLARRWLPVAVHEPANLEARSGMSLAALLSGMVIAHSGTTVVHGMGYYYTLEFGLAHGLANALLFPPVFAFNAFAVPERVGRIAVALGFCAVPPPAPEALARLVYDGLIGTLREAGVAPDAASHGVSEADAIRFAKDIAKDPYRFRNQPGTLDGETLCALFLSSVRGEFPCL